MERLKETPLGCFLEEIVTVLLSLWVVWLAAVIAKVTLPPLWVSLSVAFSLCMAIAVNVKRSYTMKVRLVHLLDRLRSSDNRSFLEIRTNDLALIEILHRDIIAIQTERDELKTRLAKQR